MKGCPLVFLSTCYSFQNIDKDSSEKNFGYVFTVHCGAKYVIGSTGKIDRGAATVFAEYFYEEYFKERSGKVELLPSAFTEAKIRTRGFYEKILRFIGLGVSIAITIAIAYLTAGTTIPVLAKIAITIATWIVNFLIAHGTLKALGIQNLDIYANPGSNNHHSNHHRSHGFLRGGFGGGLVAHRHTATVRM